MDEPERNARSKKRLTDMSSKDSTCPIVQGANQAKIVALSSLGEPLRTGGGQSGLYRVMAVAKDHDDPAVVVGAVERNVASCKSVQQILARIRVRREAACIENDDCGLDMIEERIGAA